MSIITNTRPYGKIGYIDVGIYVPLRHPVDLETDAEKIDVIAPANEPRPVELPDFTL